MSFREIGYDSKLCEMQLGQSKGAKEIQWKVEVLARSTTSNKIGCQTH